MEGVKLLPYIVLAASGLLALLSPIAGGSREVLLFASYAASVLALFAFIATRTGSRLPALLSLLSLLPLFASPSLSYALSLSILLLSLVAYMLAGRTHVLLLSLGAVAPLVSPAAGLMSALLVSYLTAGLTPIREPRSCPFRMDSNLLFFGAVIGSAGVLVQLTPLSWLSTTMWLSGLLLLLSGLIVPLGPSGHRPSSV
ncbi:MAG: hypothetical protein NZ902_03565 [Acidilobaceae archaeon]|nr:hypothetical protein [Acidilobaceae archaeon]MCX8165193.1 hypothetical protein [Acidilobaceae archaeon]MDW7974291.1 hypothetical protein [Sulfolobales archaeon]